jgi:hypothetical protein
VITSATIQKLFVCGIVCPGWNDDGGAFCKAPLGLETKCATFFDFAEVLRFAWWPPCCLQFCILADGYQNKAGTWCGWMILHGRSKRGFGTCVRFDLRIQLGMSVWLRTRFQVLVWLLWILRLCTDSVRMQSTMPTRLDRSSNESGHLHGRQKRICFACMHLPTCSEAPTTYPGASIKWILTRSSGCFLIGCVCRGLQF